MARCLSALLLIIGCLSCSVAPEHSETASGFFAPAAPFGSPDVTEFNGNVPLQNTATKNQIAGANTYRVNLGPQVVTIRTVYRDHADAQTHPNSDRPGDNLQRYLDLRATTTLAGKNLLSEGEMAYNLGNPWDGNIRPEMFRFGLKHRWQELTYGAEYNSIQKGFAPVAGAVADQSRDEALIWGEHTFAGFKFRGSVGESWERVDDGPDLRVTRTAATTLQVNRTGWAGSFLTSYGLTEHGAAFIPETAVLIRKVTMSFRPSESLRLEPYFSLTEEWNQSTGAKTQTPAPGLSFTYSPRQSGFRLTGGTSFSRMFGGDPLSDVRIHGASAALDWKLGRFLGINDRLLFSFNYNRHLDHVFRTNSHHALSSMLQLKIAGF